MQPTSTFQRVRRSCLHRATRPRVKRLLSFVTLQWRPEIPKGNAQEGETSPSPESSTPPPPPRPIPRNQQRHKNPKRKKQNAQEGETSPSPESSPPPTPPIPCPGMQLSHKHQLGSRQRAVGLQEVPLSFDVSSFSLCTTSWALLSLFPAKRKREDISSGKAVQVQPSTR